ncbi:CD1375 family protein, partial [Tuanshanicoccus yangjingiae]|uniref:CD1375 family protein n=1 Tax=Aerococcaceae bacterium zg-252 TaxID=2796928 RepID=UPI004063CC7F
MVMKKMKKKLMNRLKKIKNTLIQKLQLKGVSEMIAMLMAVRIVDGTYTFKRVPKLLKAQVESCLADLGFKVV